MPQTRANKMTVPVNADAYNLTADLATTADSANVVIPVASQAERDALTKKAGLCVIRTDLFGSPIERCDGTAWWNTQHAEWTISSSGLAASTVYNLGSLGFTQDAAVTTDAGLASISSSGMTLRDAGTYAVTITGHWSTTLSTTARAFLEIGDSAGTTTLARAPFGYTDDTATLSFSNLRTTAASTLIRPNIYQTSGTLNLTARVRLTRIGY